MDHFVPVSQLPSNGLSVGADSTHCLRGTSKRTGRASGTSLANSRGMNATPSISPAALANEAAQAHPAAPSDSVNQSTNAQGFAAAMNEASTKSSRKPAATRSTDNGKAGGSLPVAGNHSPPAATPVPPSTAAAAVPAVTQPAAGAATTPQSAGATQSTAVTAAAASPVPTPGSALTPTPTPATAPDSQLDAPGTAGASSVTGPLAQAIAPLAADTVDAEQAGGTSVSAAATPVAAATQTVPATSAASATAAANAALVGATAAAGATVGSDGAKSASSGTTTDSAPAADSAAGLAAQLTSAATTTPAASGTDNAGRAATTAANSTTAATATAPAAAANAAAAAATTQAASGDTATFLGSYLAASYQASATTTTSTSDPSAPDAGSPSVAGVSGAATSLVQSALTSAFVPAVATTLNTGVVDKRAGADAGETAPVATGSLNDGSAGAAQLNSSATAAGSTDSTPPVTVKVNAGVDTPEFSEGLADRVSWMVDSNLSSAKLQVNPPQLGPIEIRIAIQGDSAQVSLTTHSGVTRDALEASAPKLREMLGAQGFGQVSVDISQRSFQDRSASSQPYDWTPSSETKSSVASVSPVSSPMSRISSSAVDAYA